MGLFSSSYKYRAHTGSSPLFEVENRPETLRSNIIQGVTTGGMSMADAVRFALNTDMYARSKALVRYANKNYYYGFPETNQDIIAVPNSAVQTEIEAEVGEAVTLGAIYSGGPNEEFFIARHVQNVYMNPGYFPWSAGDPLVTEWDESLTDVEIPVEDPTAVPPASPYYYAPNTPSYARSGYNGHEYTVWFNYTDSNSDPQIWESPDTVNLGAYVGREWIQTRYTLDSDPSVTRYWIYEVGSNTLPALETAIVRQAVNFEYLPIVILMHDRVWFDEEGIPELEETTDKVLKRLNLDPYELKEDYIAQVQEDIDSGDRPNKKTLDEWDFFIQFAAPIHTILRGTRDYIYNFLLELEKVQVTSVNSYQSNMNTPNIPYSSLIVTEGGENGFNAEWRYAYIYSETKPGEYTPPGHTEPLKPRRLYSDVYQYGGTGDINDYMVGLREVHGAGVPTPPIGIPKEDDDLHHYAVFTKQHDDDGVKSYTQVLIMAPSLQYKVNTREDPNKVGSYRYRYDTVELFPEDPEQDSEFRFPMYNLSLKEVPAIHREEALAESLVATVYLVEKEEIKWYQKGFFKWLIIIIAVILIVLSIIFPGFIAAAAMLLTTAFGGGLLAFYIVYAILMFAVGFIISFAGNLIGGTLGVVFAVVGNIVVMGAGGLAGAPGGGGFGISTAGANGFASAVNLVNSVAPYVQGGLQIYQAYSLEKLEQDMKDFLKSAKDKYEELRDAWDMLGAPSGDITHFDIQASMNKWYVESPESFFARTLNANPGLIGYDLINSFPEIALALPEDGNDSNIIDMMIMQFEQQRGAV